MPLVTCPDCHQQFFDHDPSCPRCGRPTRAETASGPAAGEARTDTRWTDWRSKAAPAIAIVGSFLGIFVMMANLPVGVLLLVASIVVGWRLAGRS
jgi:hypothetical protein